MSSTSASSRTPGPKFIFVGEHPAIDFANTLSNPHGQLEDLLRTWPDLVSWFSKAGLSKDPSLNLSVSRAVEALKSVSKLRHAWKALLAQLIAGGKVSDEFLESLNSLLEEDNFHDTVQRHSKKGFQFRWILPPISMGRSSPWRSSRARLPASSADANLNYLHRCANTATCTLYFYDTTKNHRRRWCSVAVCGNRHKVAAFRKRQVAFGG